MIQIIKEQIKDIQEILKIRIDAYKNIVKTIEDFQKRLEERKRRK